jgi:gluconokinase
MILVITGVAGAGKSTVGRAAAAALDWPFHDADDLHTPEDVAQMARGERLSEAQRQPWLERVRAQIERIAAGGGDAVVACSALRASYRRLLAHGLVGVRFVFLRADEALARTRVATRTGHFAGADLVDSQFAVLEPPADALVLDAALPVTELAQRVKEYVVLEFARKGTG